MMSTNWPDTMRKALFLDLDHTIIAPLSGRTFPTNINDWRILPNVLKKITYYYNLKYLPIIVTNQGGVEAGYISEEDLIEKLNNISEALAEGIKGYHDDKVPYYYEPYLGDDNYNRKPNPGMAYKACLDYQLNLIPSIMVGDKDTDKLFAANAGIGHFYFTTNFFNFI